ncbi:PABS domain-containing protein [Caenorhabditis elegans]|uniref:PABS domain-containing protein n=1 Tax=Caenorhabditis elegans TaxID=6239 RepID=B4E3X6_CAEEL|nr:PABS domain-containing protein [Caenorhabditis elegans]CAR31506.1 PABS domain-containing protein [Caenorhabditis elegans]|eukprot:NP_001129829.1 SPermiDine Synthase [Caenorhabditis elegans]
MNKLHKGWFTEFSPDDLEKMNGASDEEPTKVLKSDGQEMGGAWPGQAFSLQVKKVLFHEKSKYQDVLVFESTTYGNVLVLDGIVQATERDEFSYQEMLAHLPMFAHPDPKRVLIIGGGDGGILREVLKHESVEKVTMCEIDEMVIDVAKKFLPGMSCGFSHPKLDLFCGDGFEFLKNHKNEFDVIITDSSDPVGPAESLFGQSYYELLRDALKEDGILSSQGECPWLDMKLISTVIHSARDLFPVAKYAVGSVPTYTSGLMGYILCAKDKVNTGESVWLHLPLIAHLVAFNRKIFPAVTYAQSIVSTYPSGSMGYLICAKNANRDVTTPARTLTAEQIKALNLRFYNSEVHKAAFVLPQFVKNALE